MTKTYQQATSLVDTIYTDFMMRLHYMYAEVYVPKNSGILIEEDPSTLALNLLISFESSLNTKLGCSTDELVRVNINFSRTGERIQNV